MQGKERKEGRGGLKREEKRIDERRIKRTERGMDSLRLSRMFYFVFFLIGF